MRMFKKLFLVAGLIGLIGSFGFAKEAKAATRAVQASVEDGILSWSWTSTYDPEELYVTDVEAKIGSVAVYSNSGEWQYDEGETDAVDLVQAVADNIDSFTDSKLSKVSVTLTLNNGEKLPTKDVTISMFRVEVRSNNDQMGSVDVTNSYGDAVANTFYSLSGEEYTAVATSNDESQYTFKNWTGTRGGTDPELTFAVTSTMTETANFIGSEKTIESVGIKAGKTASSLGTSEVILDYGDSLYFAATYSPDNSVEPERIEWYLSNLNISGSKSGSKVHNYSITSETRATLQAKVYNVGSDVPVESNKITVLLKPKGDTPTTKIEKVSIKAGKGTSGLDTKTITLNYGDTLHFAATYSPDDSVTADKIVWYLGTREISTKKSGSVTNNLSVDKDTPVKLYAKVNDTIESDKIDVTLKPKSDPASYVATTFKIDSDQLEYVTQGYTIEVKGTITGTYRDGSNILFEKAKGDGIKVKDQRIWKKDDSTNYFSFKVDTEDCSVSSGETLKAVIKVTAKNGKEESGVIKDLVNEEFITIEVHPKSTLSYASDTRKFSYTAPKSVNTGTESGKDSDGDKDNQLTNFTGCKGVLIKVWKGDVSGDPLWTSTSASSGGNSATINAESLVTALNNDKKLYDSGDFKFRVYPCNGSNKYNKNVYSETTIHIYKATVNGTGVTVANYYALSGQEIEIKAVPIDPAKTWTTDSYWMDDAAKKEGQTRKVKLTEDKTFTAVLGTRTTSDNSASGRAGVNKWGQSNVGIYFAIVFVIGAVCLGLHLYDRKKKSL